MSTEEDVNVSYIVYGPDGRIRQSGDCARSLLPIYASIFGEEFQAMEVPSDRYHRDIDMRCYVLNGNITDKSDVLTTTDFTIAANGIEEVSFSVPTGTQTIHMGQLVAIDDDLFSFASDIPGEFKFPFFPPASHKDFEVTIHAI